LKKERQKFFPSFPTKGRGKKSNVTQHADGEGKSALAHELRKRRNQLHQNHIGLKKEGEKRRKPLFSIAKPSPGKGKKERLSSDLQPLY